MLKNGWAKYRYVIFAILSTVVFAIVYLSVFTSDHRPHVRKFQTHFLELSDQLQKYVEAEATSLNSYGSSSNWKNFKEKEDFNLHVYRNDSLIFWNTNQLPIIRFADIHFPSDGIIHLQNGWYYAKMIKKGPFTVCGSFLIKHDYSYENKDLINEFVSELRMPFKAEISVEQHPEYSIRDSKKAFLFSLIPADHQPAGERESIVLTVLLLLSLVLWLLTAFRFLVRSRGSRRFFTLAGIILLRVVALRLNWFGFMRDTDVFQPTLYGTNEWFPNFLEYLINCAVFLFLIFSLRALLKGKEQLNYSSLLGYFLLLFGIPLWGLLIYLDKGLIENSSIPLTIDKLFSLNFYSVLALISMGSLIFGFYIYTRDIIRFNKSAGNRPITLLLISFIASLGYFVIEMTLGQQLVFSSLIPLSINCLLIYNTFRDGKRKDLVFGMLMLVIFSLVSAVNLNEFNRRKEKSERELYANQFASEQDIVTEVEYTNCKQKIEEDNVLKMLSTSPVNIGNSDFEDGLERRIFNGYWERYEMNFFLFDKKGNSLIAGVENHTKVYRGLNDIIKNHAKESEIDPNIFFITDYTDQYSYLIRQPLQVSDTMGAVLYCTLRSKKIPEEIGFPRLLISSKAQVFESLENYSIAKYHNGSLVNTYGLYNYPSSIKAIRTWKGETQNYLDFDGYNHFVLEKSKNDVILLSSKNTTWVELVTSFSYLFSFYGILLLPLLFQFSYAPFFKRTLSLAVKIQLVLIGLVFMALLAFGWGSGVFVRDQYNTYTNDVIREKLASVELELKSKLGEKDRLSISSDGNYMEYLLQKFSKVFVTDINLYDPSGFLMASSRPKVFNIGLLSEQMNPSAFYSFHVRNKSEFVHDESIGELNYASAYLPFVNNEGKMLGYLNLQHFGQQKDFETQIQGFLVAIVNVFMLLLAISIVLAVFISNWLTAPLRLLQENFANIRFGKANSRISYNKEDEIGALVKDYNQKLDELEYTAQQLAQSERESAWREMAKQVAHEIKNPLTPMKLSIQQLLRVYDPKDPDSEKKLQKVAGSIIEQIDALTNIANEFSNFAKMPRPDEISLDLIPLLENVIEVFRQEINCKIAFNKTENSMMIRADKDQMVRTFNNLIKNAIQSIPEDREGLIRISVKKNEQKVRIEVADNGCGIPVAMRSKIFVPYFTTKSTGTGLGLAMVRQIVENHRGTIDFESTENVGTTIIINLPQADE